MLPIERGSDTLRRMFAGLTEQVFQVDLGIADPALIDYVSALLVRFVSTDALAAQPGPGAQRRRLTSVTEMLLEAQRHDQEPRRRLLRQVGDFTLFWEGVYPEALPRLQAPEKPDHLLDYRESGKWSYRLASQLGEDAFEGESRVLRFLSDEFELCTDGLSRVRQTWETLADDPGQAGLN